MIQRRDYLKTAGAVSVGTLGSIAGCIGFGGTNWERNIAITTPQTGPIGYTGEAIIQGGRVAVEEVNAESDAADITVSTADTEGSVEQARSVVQEAIDDGSVAITGTVSSDVTIATRNLLEEEQVPQVTPIAGNPEITPPGTEYTFRVPGDEEQKEFGTLQFLAENDVSSVAIIGADFSYPRQTVEYFRQYAPDFDINVEHVSFVPFGTDNFQPELNKFSDDDIDALWLPYPGANAITLIQQIREAGLFEDNVVLGDYSYGSTPYLQGLGQDIVGVNNWGADLTSQRSQEVIATMEERYDTRAAIYHLLGYDTAKVIALAINAADSLDPQAVRDAIAETDYDAASGWQVTFDDSGHCATYRMIINQWEDRDGDMVNARRFRSDVIPADPSM